MSAVLPVKRLANVVLGKMVQPESKSAADISAPYLRAAHVQPQGKIIDLPLQPMWFHPSELRGLDLRRGDVVIVEGGAGYGRSAVVREDLPGWGFQNSIIRLRPLAGRADGRFLDYALQDALMRGRVDLFASTATIPHFTADKVSKFEISAPDLVEQRGIANFLDRETGQIDALISKQEEFVEFLRERRSGLIASAVAGLDYGASLEPGEVSWIGSCPPGWIRGQVKHFGSVNLGKMLQSENKGSDVLAPYMRAANVQPDGELALGDAKTMWFSTREMRMLDLRAGDVVVVEGGIGGYGRAAFISEPLDGWGFQNSINRIRPAGENDGRYLTYFLIMARQKGFITAYCNIVSMPHLTAEKLAAMPIMIPPSDVQRQIADRLDEETAKISALIAKAKEHIAFAKERRSALITAAVTGQIDVRPTRKAG
ncbi:restriction endonuclease subunit S [Streptomyces sp. NPDC048211]|uniref:restriction endonuclease subunit S n=1 Tax=Streptomyces sp. NPDC048211 TaxID=3365516 RepID=UPI0037129ED2